MLHAVGMTGWIEKPTESYITCCSRTKHVRFLYHVDHVDSSFSAYCLYYSYTRYITISLHSIIDSYALCRYVVYPEVFQPEDLASGMVPSSVSWQVSPSPLQGMLGTSAPNPLQFGKFWHLKAKRTCIMYLSELFQCFPPYQGALAVCAKMLAAILSPKAAITPCIRQKANDCERLQELWVGWFGKISVFPSLWGGRSVEWGS